MSFGDYLYIVAIILFSYMTFTIVRNNFLSKFDDKQRRKDLVDQYEDDYVNVDDEVEAKEESKEVPREETKKD
jgi:DNA-directed RNA polymerase specialized sigma24 family protein